MIGTSLVSIGKSVGAVAGAGAAQQQSAGSFSARTGRACVTVAYELTSCNLLVLEKHTYGSATEQYTPTYGLPQRHRFRWGMVGAIGGLPQRKCPKEKSAAGACPNGALLMGHPWGQHPTRSGFVRSIRAPGRRGTYTTRRRERNESSTHHRNSHGPSSLHQHPRPSH